MKNEWKLSKKSQDFLENLRVYLFSSGKNSNEIDEITEELEGHLIEAEKNGKPIEKIIGSSPKEYMKMISKEMLIDYRTWVKYSFLIIFTSFSFIIFSDLLKGNLSYSILEIVGHIVIGAVFIISMLIGFKYLSTSSQSIVKKGLILVSLSLLPLVLYIVLIYINRSIETSIIYLSSTGSLIVTGIAACTVLGISYWAKSWVIIIIVALLTLPKYLLSLTSLSQEAQIMIEPWIIFMGIAMYLLVLNKTRKKSNA